ncbi:MAG: ABC transporter ATP-binding protein [Rhodobiaceae bacterium]|nr:ABC transporter ATP-binding protein [Rhodobiaceae bacterium]MCC0047562.1 ABC transporter ATP-binding protein [Rhodobiaceae bacterium]
MPDAAAGKTLLEVSDLQAWYGDSHILHGVNMSVGKGELVTILGRNGAGKSTTLRSIIGLLSKKTGSMRIQGVESINSSPTVIARLGVAYCPEERGIYASLSVGENLTLPPKLRDGGLSTDEIFTMFPNIKDRLSSRGSNLSGGEQQMLAIARILRTGADILLLDEPTEGLAPVIVQQIEQAITALKQRGFTIVLVEQNHRFAQKVADRHYVMESGKIVDELTNDTIAQEWDRVTRYLSV